MIGAPMPIAVLERKLVSGSMTSIISGRPQVACVEFTDPTNPRFTCRERGQYLAIFQSETKRLALSVAITAPVAAAITQNSNTWNVISQDQIMSVGFAYSGTWSITGTTVQTREWVPFEHVSHPFRVDLAKDEECVLNVTSAASDRQWMLAVWRLGPK